MCNHNCPFADTSDPILRFKIENITKLHLTTSENCQLNGFNYLEILIITVMNVFVLHDMFFVSYCHLGLGLVLFLKHVLALFTI